MSKRFLRTLILSGVTALVLSGCGADLHEAARDNSLTTASSLIYRGADIEAKAKGHSPEQCRTSAKWDGFGNREIRLS